jgi:hypothetical protein
MHAVQATHNKYVGYIVMPVNTVRPVRSARSGNLEVPVNFLQAKQGHAVKKWKR